MQSAPAFDLATGAGLIACPRCDALHRDVAAAPGERLRCTRCRTLLEAPREGAFTRIIALSLASLVLMVAAVFFPFLEISRMGFGNATSLFGVAMAFADGILAPLTVAVLALIVGLPVLRAALLVYTLAPLAGGGRPRRHARTAFRWAEELKPWSMGEIFVIGTSIALVKVGGVATISLGPAFWAFCALIVVNAASQMSLSAATVWNALEGRA